MKFTLSVLFLLAANALVSQNMPDLSDCIYKREIKNAIKFGPVDNTQSDVLKKIGTDEDAYCIVDYEKRRDNPYSKFDIISYDIDEKTLIKDLRSVGYLYIGVDDILNEDSAYKIKYNYRIKRYFFYKPSLAHLKALEEKEEHDKAMADCLEKIRISKRITGINTKLFNEAVSDCSYCCQDALEYGYYKEVPGYLKREDFIRLFPNSKYNAKIKQDIADIQSGKKREVSMFEALGQAYNNSAVSQAVQEVSKAIPKSTTTETALPGNANYQILEQVNVEKFEIDDTTAQPSNSLSVSVGCNSYKHQLDKENDGFNVVYLAGEKTYTVAKDLSFFKNEIDSKSFYDEGVVLITFLSDRDKLVTLKIKFKKGGYYRIEVFPKQF